MGERLNPRSEFDIDETVRTWQADEQTIREALDWTGQPGREEALAALNRLTARASTEAETLEAADLALRWLANNESAAIRRLPTALYQRLRKASATLNEPEPDEPAPRAPAERPAMDERTPAEHALVRFKNAARAVRPRYRELNSPLWDVLDQAVALAERATELERERDQRVSAKQFRETRAEAVRERERAERVEAERDGYVLEVSILKGELDAAKKNASLGWDRAERAEEALQLAKRGCTGTRHCGAIFHVHGCLSDRGQCDQPHEHARREARDG